jgi:hypothetical protein
VHFGESFGETSVKTPVKTPERYRRNRNKELGKTAFKTAVADSGLTVLSVVTARKTAVTTLTDRKIGENTRRGRAGLTVETHLAELESLRDAAKDAKQYAAADRC